MDGLLQLTDRYWKAISLCLFVFAFAQEKVFASDIVLTGAKIYPSPNVEALEDGAIVVSEGRIRSIGAASDLSNTERAAVIDVSGKVITAGLWNAHVHFALPSLDTISDDVVVNYVNNMLLQYGFVHVLDTGSLPGVTQEIRRRVDAGEIRGPTILIAGASLVPAGASPFICDPRSSQTRRRQPGLKSS